MKKVLSIMLALFMVVTMIPMAVLPASAAYDYDETAKISFKITNLVCEWKGETEELGEYGSAFYEQSLTKVADGKYKYTYRAALSAGGGTWWSDPKTVTFDGVDCESNYYKTFDFTESTPVGGYTMTWTYTLEVKRYKGHAYGAWSDNGDGTHTSTCAINSAHKETASHNYAAATCSAPETCKNCGATQGEPVADAHSWNAATCVLPQTCKYCGITQGEVLGHNMVAATFGKPAACSRCGATDINISVLEAALINTNVNLPSKAVKDDNAGYNDITWSVVDAGSTGATINGNTLKASYSGEAVIRATIESDSKDFTILFKSSENIDISLGSVIVSQKDASTLTVAYAGFEGGSKDYMVGEPILITGTAANEIVHIKDNTTASVILENVTINNTDGANPFIVYPGAVVSLTLVGDSHLSSTDEWGGSISVDSDSALTISGDGTLTTTSSGRGAALGSRYKKSGGTIVVEGGTIVATNRYRSECALGNGVNGNGTVVTITGGSVKTSGTSVTPTNGSENASQSLSCKTIILNGAGDGVSVSDIDVPEYYSAQGVTTMDGGKIYLWLPADTMPTCITAGGNEYICNRNLTYYTSHGELVDATCFKGQHCAECGYVLGEALDHNFDNGVCTLCGFGETDGVFYISTAKQLMVFADFVNKENVNANATLMADIDLAEYTWTPIGVTAMGEGVTNGYTGHFDGNGHVIRNVTFATPASAMAAGIFGTVQNGGTVRNLGVENLSFDDNTYDHRAGGIAGQLLADSTISDCYVRNSTVKASSRVVGGIVGMNYGTVKNCYTCNMSLAGYNNRFGGISGDFSAGKLENCYTDYSALASSQAGTTANCKAGVSADVFASGEIAYLLSGSTSEGDLVWGQLIGTDSYPVFGGETVYYNETNGYYNILHTCDFSGEWKYDAQKHWKECTADSCDKISEEADHSFTDGKCDCGYTCPHSSYTNGVCDTCDYECPHYYGEGVLTRPERITTTEWDDGFYAYTCSVCDHYYQETVKRADYAAYDAVSDDYYAIIMNSSVLGSVKDALKDAVDSLYQNHADVMAGDRIESEQEAVDKVVAEFEKLVSDAEEKIASDEYLKADYTAIDEAIADIEQKFVDENVTDEAKAGLDEIKTQLEAMKADENTSKADLAELEKALGDYEAELDKGIEDGTLVKFSGERVFLAFVEEAEKKIDEQFGENAFYDFANANRDSFYNSYDKYFFRAAALEGGTMAENAENIEYIKGMVDELFGMVANCLDGTHNYGEGVLTRPTFETAGYYTYTCTLCGHSYTVPTEKADDTALYDASMKVMEYIDNNTLTQEAKDEIYKSYRDIQENNGNVFDELGFVRGDLIEEDQPVIDAVTEALQKIIADADEKIASGEYVKADYNGIYQAIHRIKDKLHYEDVTDEGKAGLEEIKKQLAEMKADENTSAADLAELEKALSEYEAEIDKGIEDGTLVSVRPEKIGTELSDKWKEWLEAEGLTDEYKDFIDNQKATDEALAAAKELVDFLYSLEGTVAENAENLAKLNEMLDSLYSSFENCLRGTHNFNDYEVTSPAKCEVNAIETRTCWFCGETDEREVEGTALSHSFTKYEETEAPKCGVAGKEVAYCDNGCQTTDERETPALEHIFLDYVSNGDATCEADGTKTAACDNGCGKKDTVADEGSKLDHVDENGDDLCDECGNDMRVSVADCECTCHRDDPLNQFFNKIIQLIRRIFGINSTCECGTVHTSGLTPIWKIFVS